VIADGAPESRSTTSLETASQQWPMAPEAARQHLADSLARIADYADAAVWIHRAPPAVAEQQLADAISRALAGEHLPLLGLVIGVKDNIDVASMPTTAACPDFTYLPDRSATVVRRLIDAGAVIVGKTNMDQFATGLVGTRSPYGACRNVYDDRYISGGSSSGSAVAVAAGLVDASLGTDTAGSGRIPAAFNNIIGLKPTCGLLSTTGVVPACRSLDCVSIFARHLDTAYTVLDVARGFDAQDIYSRHEPTSRPTNLTGPFRFGVPEKSHLEFYGNHEVARLYAAAITRFEALGGTRVTIDYAPFRDAARLLYEGPWVAERFAAIEPFITRSPESLLPVTRQIIAGATKYSAADTFKAIYQLRALRQVAEIELNQVDVMLLPTAGTIYTFAQIQADPIRLNQNLGRYTNFVNLLDLSALALPAGFQSDGLPAGITLIGPAWHDHVLYGFARQFLAEPLVGSAPRTISFSNKLPAGDETPTPFTHAHSAKKGST
jgi:allophanate hydrolase